MVEFLYIMALPSPPQNMTTFKTALWIKKEESLTYDYTSKEQVESTESKIQEL